MVARQFCPDNATTHAWYCDTCLRLVLFQIEVLRDEHDLLPRVGQHRGLAPPGRATTAHLFAGEGPNIQNDSPVAQLFDWHVIRRIQKAWMASMLWNSNITTGRVSCSPSSTSTFPRTATSFPPNPAIKWHDGFSVLLKFWFIIDGSLDNEICGHDAVLWCHHRAWQWQQH